METENYSIGCNSQRVLEATENHPQFRTVEAIIAMPRQFSQFYPDHYLSGPPRVTPTYTYCFDENMLQGWYII